MTTRINAFWSKLQALRDAWTQFWRRMCPSCEARRARVIDVFVKYVPALAPVIWIGMVGLCILLTLSSVGYLSKDDDVASVYIVHAALTAKSDVATRRGLLAYSGVTLAITLALAVTSLFWAGSAFRGKTPKFRCAVYCAVALVVGGGLYVATHCIALPFTSSLGNMLLYPPFYQPEIAWSGPDTMFALAIIVPATLTAGACFLLDPVHRSPLSGKLTQADSEGWLRQAPARLKELDQLLYIGALTLVFGTLQLSAAMTTALAGMPKMAELKTRAELCKALTPALPINDETAKKRIQRQKDAKEHAVRSDLKRGALKQRTSTPSQCLELTQEFDRADVADSLRQLVRGVTLSLGLAFSALLAAIYVPALVSMRSAIVYTQEKLVEIAPTAPKVIIDTGEVDPLHRIATTIATLSPLIAGLVANALSST